MPTSLCSMRLLFSIVYGQIVGQFPFLRSHLFLINVSPTYHDQQTLKTLVLGLKIPRETHQHEVHSKKVTFCCACTPMLWVVPVILIVRNSEMSISFQCWGATSGQRLSNSQKMMFLVGWSSSKHCTRHPFSVS